MKKSLFLFLIMLLFNFNAYACPIDWCNDIDSLTEKAKSILIAECTEIITKEVPVDGETQTKIKVLSVLKGPKEKNTIEIFSYYRLEVGKKYLLSSNNDRYFNGRFSAVLLDEYFDLVILENMNLKEKLSYIFNRRLRNIITNLSSLNFEKTGLEKFLKIKTPNQ